MKGIYTEPADVILQKEGERKFLNSVDNVTGLSQPAEGECRDPVTRNRLAGGMRCGGSSFTWQRYKLDYYVPMVRNWISKLFRRAPRRPAIDEDEWRPAPENPDDVAGWNFYWEGRVKSSEPHNLSFLFEIGDILVPAFRRLNVKRIFCPGGGISLEPRGLALAGFQVVVADVSTIAMDFARNFQPSAAQLQRSISRENYSDGGSVEFVAGDFRDELLFPGPYDAIVTHRTLQLFEENIRSDALLSLERRLTDSGVFICHDHNAGWATAKWFKNKPYTISLGYTAEGVRRLDGGPFLTAEPGKRAAWMISSSG